MKIFLMYYDRFENSTTSKALNKINEEHFILCHNNKNKFKNTFGKIIETKQPKGIQNNFNFALNTLNENEWAIFMSDDYKCSKILKNGKFVDCGLDKLINELKRIILKIDNSGIKMVGFNSSGNPFYAKKKFSKFGLVDGRFFAIKKTKFRFHSEINCIPDYFASLYHLKKYGGNLIINQMFADFERYKKGGLGTEIERLNDKIKNIKILKSEFPNNIILKDKPNQPKKSHIIIKR